MPDAKSTVLIADRVLAQRGSPDTYGPRQYDRIERRVATKAVEALFFGEF